MSGVFFSCLLLVSCSTGKYLTDPNSVKRHEEMRKARKKLNVTEVVRTVGSVVVAAASNGRVSARYASEGKQFRKMNFYNISADTLYINMLSDHRTEAGDFYDFRNIKLPPQETCRLLMPVGIACNVYFRNTREPAEGEEMIEVNSGGKRKIFLYSGMTVPRVDLSEKQE